MKTGLYYLLPKDSVDSLHDLFDAMKDAIEEVITRSKREIDIEHLQGDCVKRFYEEKYKLIEGEDDILF